MAWLYLRVSIQKNLRNALAYFFPFHPFVVDHKVFSSLRRSSPCYRWTAPLVYFTAITVFCPSFSLSPLLQGDDLYEVRRPYSMLSKTETRFSLRKSDQLSLPSRIQGFGYPPVGLARLHFLESLFQPSTLLGFAFQSFSPFRWS